MIPTTNGGDYDHGASIDDDDDDDDDDGYNNVSYDHL